MPGKDLVPIVQEAGWAPGPVWTGGKSPFPPGFDPRTVQPVVSHYTNWTWRMCRTEIIMELSSITCYFAWLQWKRHAVRSYLWKKSKNMKFAAFYAPWRLIRGVAVWHYSFLSCAELVSFMLWLLTPKSKCCQYYWTEGWVSPQSVCTLQRREKCFSYASLQWKGCNCHWLLI
jgi:hypothetical protein